MKVGQKISWVRDEVSPLKSLTTDLIIAWKTCGGQLSEGTNFLDTVEQTESGLKREVTWSADGDCVVSFGSEQVDFEEFRRRWLSDDWQSENAEHPISYMRKQSDHNRQVRGWLRDQKPAALIRRGARTAVIPSDCDPARKAKILLEL